MSQTYHITMDGGTYFVSVRADSAATAIGTALERNRGFRVVSCHTGGVHNPAFPSHFAQMDFPIPAHEPLPPIEKVKRVPPPCTLFDDAEILAESEKAKKRHD